ncbi:STAS domain-containing protein [Streptomyces sp. NPDC020472]|uniref:STAS domain-containing protein n=1 Tax=Streptomyces sp. NPDC020472 TaxID=3365075 RepID=UPI00378C23D1
MTRLPERFALVFEPGPRRTSARVSGEIDLDNAAEVREALTAALDASCSGLDVDLAALTFCDSAGLHVLLDVHQQALQAGKSLALTALSRPVARLLRITGTQEVLTASDLPAPEAHHADACRPARAKALTGQRSPLPFEIRTRHFGQTVHLTLAGELDMDTRPALDEVQTPLEGVDLVACDMARLSFLDVAGLHGLLDFAYSLDKRGITFFAYNWQPQPRRLLDLLDDRYPPDDPDRPALLLRHLRDAADAARSAGAAEASRNLSGSSRPRGHATEPGCEESPYRKSR